MPIQLFPHRQLPPILQDYLQGKLRDYVAFEPAMEQLLQAAAQRKFDDAGRQTLHQVLEEQYQSLPKSTVTERQLQKLLEPQTFTITTGHQLMIGGGPMFMFWKIMHTMAMAEQLNETQSSYHFIPVFWMASEDHDLEEIKSVKVFQQDYSWSTAQSGAVGRMNTAGLDELVRQWAALFKPGDPAEKYIQIFVEAYQCNTLSEATAYIFHQIFGSRGLLILDADHPALKARFSDYICKDVLTAFNEPFLRKTTEQLGVQYKTQVSPRQINFFELTDGQRSRIKGSDEGGHSYTEAAIRSHPEKFSPNVCLRPLYQEVLLPNVAYIGGPGEISYWLQLKAMFDANEVPFPVLVPRHSVFLLPESFEKKWKALGFETKDIFESKERLQKTYIDRHSEKTETEEIVEALHAIHRALTDLGEQTDATLIPAAEAAFSRIKEQADGFIKKVEKHRKAAFDLDLQKINKLYDDLYPGGAGQDRTLNILSCASYANLEEVFEHMKTSFSAVLICN